ncbi:MAG: hypothetical protein IPN63_02910 [Gammaproteobacteria bacterium]|nr:hypothetical protein [Gammaproteobacteria bacterium]
MSPRGASSTLMMSAPISAIRRVVVGPASAWVKSRTLQFANIRFTVMLLRSLLWLQVGMVVGFAVVGSLPVCLTCAACHDLATFSGTLVSAAYFRRENLQGS